MGQTIAYLGLSAAAMLVDKIGRRPLFLMSNGGMIVVFIFWTLTAALWTTQANRPAANASIAFMALYLLTYSIGQSNSSTIQ
jgi:hypothetical protein